MNHLGPIVAERDTLRVRDCRACGYTHLDPIPADTAEFYKSSFWQIDKAGELAHYERQAEWLAAIHGDWLDIIEAMMRGRRLLDVGSGYGFFLRTAESRRWKCLGIEPSTAAAKYSDLGEHDYTIAQTRWHADMGGRQYDCISALWLIEHLPDPAAFINWCAAHLAPDGVLLLAFPNEWTEAQSKANAVTRNKYWWVHHTHINYFTPHMMRDLLDRSNMYAVVELGTAQMEDYITPQNDYTVSPDYGREVHSRIEWLELHQRSEERIEDYNQRGLRDEGRDLIVFARKQP